MTKSMKTCWDRILRFPCLALVAAILLGPAPAFAVLSGSDKMSMNFLVNVGVHMRPLTTAEAYLSALIDPISPSVSGLGISLSYDPSKYKFRADLSGLVGEFSQGGPNVPASAAYGSVLLSDKPVAAFSPGTPLPGSTLIVSDNTVAGIVTVDYTLGTPLVLEPIDRNWISLTFQAYVPFNPYKTVATSFDHAGTYDFTQLSNSGAGSATPVYGINIRPVPDSSNSAVLLMGSLVALAGFAHKRKGLK